MITFDRLHILRWIYSKYVDGGWSKVNMTTIHTAISLDNLEKDAGTKSEGPN